MLFLKKTAGNTEWGKSRFIVVSTQNKEFLFIIYYIPYKQL